MADAPDTPAEIRARLQTEALRRAREDLRQRAAGNPYQPPTDARDARRRGVEAAIARGEEPAGRFEGIAAVLPPSVQAAAGLPVKRLRILREDVPDSLPRETPAAALYARVRDWFKTTTPHGVSVRCYEAAAKTYLHFEEKRGGFVQAGYKAWAAFSGYCARHMQRAVLGLEGAGILDVMNVPYREDDEWRRDENIYVASMDAEPPPVPADVAAPDPVLPASVSRALGGGSRLAAWFGLVLRAGGLNTSPASNYRTRPRPA